MITINNNYGEVYTNAKWISFKDVLPTEGQLILTWPINHFYMDNDPEDADPFHIQMAEMPYIERFKKKEYDMQGEKPDCSDGGYDLYSFSEYWMPIPDLPEEANGWQNEYDGGGEA